MLVDVAVQVEPFDVAAAHRRLTGMIGGWQVGAIASFVGRVRDINEGAAVTSLYLEHYPDMTERSLRTIGNEAGMRFDIQGVLVIHRVGLLHPGDDIVLVLAAGMHRKAAFAACEFVMDHLKTRAPFWKKEVTADGDRWVAARAGDAAAAAAWVDEGADSRPATAGKQGS